MLDREVLGTHLSGINLPGKGPEIRYGGISVLHLGFFPSRGLKDIIKVDDSGNLFSDTISNLASCLGRNDTREMMEEILPEVN